MLPVPVKDQLRQARLGTLKGALLAALGFGGLIAIVIFGATLTMAPIAVITCLAGASLVLGVRLLDRNLHQWDQLAIGIFLAKGSLVPIERT
jgi:hypothetical protein